MKLFLVSALLICYNMSYGQFVCPKEQFAVLPYRDGPYTSLPKNSTPAILIDSDIVSIDRIVLQCISKYNTVRMIDFKKIVKKYPGREIINDTIDIKKYYRQYIVAKNNKGEKEVWVNCFCTIQHMDYWAKEIVMVKDGGNCFFNLRINLTKESYTDFMVNGYA